MSDFTLYQGDCLEVMPTLDPGSVAMVFADLPYGVTDNAWDRCISLKGLWQALQTCCLADAVKVFTASMPFGADIINSNRKNFRYDLQWLKTSPTGYLFAKKRPLRCHENLLVFYGKQPTYNPQMVNAKTLQGKTVRVPGNTSANYTSRPKGTSTWVETGKRYPLSYTFIKSETRQKSLHPTQKPLALLEWLIATYTNPGDTVLDPTMGSGTTGAACARLGRKFIGIEKDPNYFTAAKARIEAAYASPKPPQGALAV